MKRIKRKIFKRQSDLIKAAVSAVVNKTDKAIDEKAKLSQKEMGNVRLKILLNQSAIVREREEDNENC